MDRQFEVHQARIAEDVSIGQGVVIIQPVNLYGCELASGCFVGPFVEIQRNVKVGKNTRIESHSFICEGASIGVDCFVAHGVMFINDRFSSGRPAYGQPESWEETHLGDRVCIGSNATLLPVSICSDVVVGAGSVVVADIDEPGIYAGNPVRKIRDLESME